MKKVISILYPMANQTTATSVGNAVFDRDGVAIVSDEVGAIFAGFPESSGFKVADYTPLPTPIAVATPVVVSEPDPIPIEPAPIAVATPVAVSEPVPIPIETTPIAVATPVVVSEPLPLPEPIPVSEPVSLTEPQPEMKPPVIEVSPEHNSMFSRQESPPIALLQEEEGSVPSWEVLPPETTL